MVDWLDKYCRELDLNARLILAAIFHETGALTSARYVNWRNPGGIAIQANSSVEVWRPLKLSPRQTAAAMVAAMGQKFLERSVEREVPEAYQITGMRSWLARSLALVSAPEYPSPIRVPSDMSKPFTDATGDLQYVWAEDQQWGQGVLGWYDRIPKAKGTPVVTTTPEPTTATTHKFGNVAHPPFVDKLVTDAQSHAWDNLGQRHPIGVCQHSMVGTLQGTSDWFRRGAASDGLTDYGIGNDTDGPSLDGVIFRFNDPTGAAHAGVSANRAGWANGGSDGLEGDGTAFVRNLGINAINKDLVSIERSDNGQYNTQPMSAKQFESICRLTAYWFDYAKVPFEDYPLNPAVGIVTHMIHKEFATKDCPFPPVYNRIDEIQDRVRAILKAGQSTVEETSTPPVNPPKTTLVWPHGWTTKELGARFGELTKIDAKGKTSKSGFSEKGVISNAWVQRANKAGFKKIEQLPKPASWNILPVNKAAGLTPEVIVFDAPGLKNWMLYRPDSAIGWAWVDGGAGL